MADNVKFIEVKAYEPILQKRKELTKVKMYSQLGPADSCLMFYSKEASFLSKKE